MPDARVNVQLGEDRLAPELLGLLSRIEVRESDDEPTVCALRFNLRQLADGSLRPLDDTRLAPLSRLAIDMAAPGGRPQRLFDGFLTHVRPHLEATLPNCFVEVVAMDAAVLMDAGQRVAQYPNASDSDAAAEVFARYDLATDIDETVAVHAEDDRLLLQRDTDWRFVQRLARRNGFSCFLQHDPRQDAVVAHFHPRRLDEEPQADLGMLHDQRTLNHIDLQVRHTGPARHQAAGIDPILKQVLRSDGEVQQELLGDQGGAALNASALTGAGADVDAAQIVAAMPLDEALGAEATAASQRDTWIVEAQGEVDVAAYRGLLRARRTALIKGIGSTHSGTWYVRSVRTVLDQGALSQHFVAERNALGLAGNEDFGQSAEEVEAT